MKAELLSKVGEAERLKWKDVYKDDEIEWDNCLKMALGSDGPHTLPDMPVDPMTLHLCKTVDSLRNRPNEDKKKRPRPREALPSTAPQSQSQSQLQSQSQYAGHASKRLKKNSKPSPVRATLSPEPEPEPVRELDVEAEPDIDAVPRARVAGTSKSLSGSSHRNPNNGTYDLKEDEGESRRKAELQKKIENKKKKQGGKKINDFL